jgi:hypothetical protein
MPQPTPATVRKRLAQAWCRLEGLSGAAVDDWPAALRAIREARAEPGLRPRPQPVDATGLMQLWSGLPAGARDLLVLRAVAGMELAEIAALQARALALIEREWLLLARRLSTRAEDWPRRLRESIQACAPAAPATAAPRRGLQLLCGLAGATCFAAAVFAPQLHYALLLDPAQQRLQAPAPAAPLLREEVPLSAAEFPLFADPVEFSLLAQLDFLLWRLQSAGQPSAPAQPAESAPPEGAANALPALAVLQPWASQWPRLDPSQREQLLRHAQLWESLDAPGRVRLAARAEGFAALPPLERAELRARFERYRSLSPPLQQALGDARAEFEALPEPQQQALRAEFAALPASTLRQLAAEADPALLDLAGDAFGFVPAGEREATLALLADFDEDTHRLLRAMARRLDASQREALRGALIEASESERMALLRERATSVGLAPR